MANRFLQNNDLLGDFFERVETLPSEIGTEAVHQVKGGKKSGDDNSRKDPKVSEEERKKLLNSLYGTSETEGMPIQDMSGEELRAISRQRAGKFRNKRQSIEDEIRAYRAKKAQEISAYERGMTQGTQAPKDQQDKMELWQEEQKKHEEKMKKQKEITMPGSAQSRSGEQGVVMG